MSGLILAAVALASRPAVAQTGHTLTFINKVEVGTGVRHVLALPEGVAFSEGAVLRLYDAAGTAPVGSLPLPCDIAGLGRVGNNVIASTCEGVAVVNIADRAAPELVRAIPLNTDICPLEEESNLMGLAVDGDYAYVGLWTSGCVLNWQTGATLYDIGDWVTRLQVYSGYLFTLEENSAYDEEVIVHGSLPQALTEGEVEVQYVTNDFAVAADKVFSTASSPDNEGLCATAWDPNTHLGGARLGCLYTDAAGATKVAASADSVRGDNVFTVRAGQLRWVKSAGAAALVEVAAAPYTADVYDLGTGGDQYVYAAGADGLSVFRFEHVGAAPPAPGATPTQPPPSPAPALSQRLHLPLALYGP